MKRRTSIAFFGLLNATAALAAALATSCTPTAGGDARADGSSVGTEASLPPGCDFGGDLTRVWPPLLGGSVVAPDLEDLGTVSSHIMDPTNGSFGLTVALDSGAALLMQYGLPGGERLSIEPSARVHVESHTGQCADGKAIGGAFTLRDPTADLLIGSLWDLPCGAPPTLPEVALSYTLDNCVPDPAFSCGPSISRTMHAIVSGVPTTLAAGTSVRTASLWLGNGSSWEFPKDQSPCIDGSASWVSGFSVRK